MGIADLDHPTNGTSVLVSGKEITGLARPLSFWVNEYLAPHRNEIADRPTRFGANLLGPSALLPNELALTPC